MNKFQRLQVLYNRYLDEILKEIDFKNNKVCVTYQHKIIKNKYQYYIMYIHSMEESKILYKLNMNTIKPTKSSKCKKELSDGLKNKINKAKNIKIVEE